jgi:4-hydroxy-tetrahydrodipicolinate synthase
MPTKDRKDHGLPRGIVASSVTPSDGNGNLLLPQIKPHIDWLIDQGVDGLSPLGSAGEFFAFEVADRKRILETVIEANAGRRHIMAGTHHYCTRTTIELSRHAEKAGANSLLVVQPYYGSPSVSQAQDHYRRLAEAVSIPVVLYHNLSGTNVNLRTEHLLALFEEGAIAGVKMSNSDPARICELLHATDGKFVTYAGIDTVAFEGLCHGAYGWISGIPSLVPKVAKELYELIAIESDLPSARILWKKLAPLMRLFFSGLLNAGGDPQWNSILKTGLNMIGPSVGELVAPVSRLDGVYEEQLSTILRGLGYTVRNLAD